MGKCVKHTLGFKYNCSIMVSPSYGNMCEAIPKENCKMCECNIGRNVSSECNKQKCVNSMDKHYPIFKLQIIKHHVPILVSVYIFRNREEDRNEVTNFQHKLSASFL